jgi:endoglucanase
MENNANKPETAVRKAPFSRGVNFSKWFEERSAQTVQFARFIEQDFINIKSMGADVARVPIRFHDMTGDAPDYALDPALLGWLDTAAGWAEKHGVYLILDNHSFHPVDATEESVKSVLLKVWAQIAERYKGAGKHVVYEVLNEPHGIDDGLWGEIQGAAIETIRKADKTRAIIVGGTEYNSINKLFTIPQYSDPNLIYTFHFYDPFIFTHQGATWCRPSLAPLAGVPFPYDAARIPETPEALKGTYIESSLRSYEKDSAFSELCARLDRAAAFANERDVPVFCGEFGVYMVQSPAEDRVKWYEFVSQELDKRNISRASWDYFGGFGVFNGPGGDFFADLNTGVVKAMGFTPPPQRVKITRP